MENNRTEILQELEAELASLKEQVRAFEDRLEAFRQLPEEDIVEESDFTDMEIGVPDLPEQEPVPEPVPEPVSVPEPEPVIEPEPVVEAEPVLEPEPVAEPDPEPVLAPEPAPALAPEPMPAPKPAAPAVPRPETDRLPWRLDKPGISVKNIRSGISLYDRALFIGTLFKEDYALYDKTISELNGLSSLDEAVDYLLERFPDWNLKSDIVYNFMMAVRKKLG
jgi:Predicted membrane protein